MTDASQVQLRPATPQDAATILGFVRDLAAFEKEAPETVKLTEEAILQYGFGEDHRFKVLLAELDNEPVGMALFFETFSTWTARPGLWIEELFVEEPYRGRGIGRMLLDAVVDRARSLGYGRVELAVLDWNPAKDFYEARGFRQMSEWRTYRLDMTGTDASKGG